jgi:hypothetical protein
MGPAHLEVFPGHVGIRVHLVQIALSARASFLRGDAREAFEGL